MSQQIVTCGHERKPIPVQRRGRHLVVDIHCHLHVGAADALIAEAMPDRPMGMPFSSAASAEVNRQMLVDIAPRLNGVAERLQDMDRLGIDVQAISPAPSQYFYFAPAELGRDTARLVNDGIAQAVALHPERLVGMGTVPLQNVEMAIEEMRRCVRALDLRGIEISSNVNGVDLDAPQLRPFWREAEALGILIFMHPLGFTHGQRLSDHHFNNIIGNPLEATIALSHLIFGGVLKDHAGLKLCVAHGGGYLPGYWGRMDHAWRARADCRQHIAVPPSTYLRKVWLDTLVLDRMQLDHLIASHGAERLCLGTDYPYDMAEPDPVALHDHLADDIHEKIVGGNAASLLGLIANNNK